MNHRLQEEQRIRRYLLGQLPVDERERLEERLFTDKDLLAAIDVVNDELTDEYVFDELSNADRTAYAKAFEAQPERRTQERLAIGLRRYVEGKNIANGPQEKAGRSSSWFLRHPALAYALAAALMVTSISTALLFYKVNALQDEVIRLNVGSPSDDSTRRIEELTAGNDELQKQLANEQTRTNETNPIDVDEKDIPPQKVNPNTNRSDNQSPRPTIATFLLKPGLVRDGGQTRITLNPSIRSVNLQPMLLQNIYPRYGATLSTVDGKNISTVKSLTARNTRNGAVVFIPIASELLQNGEYSLKVNGEPAEGGTEDVASYSFRIIRQP